MKQNILCLYFFLVIMSLQAVGEEFRLGNLREILPVDQAFVFGYSELAEEIDLFWQIEPGYFLYRDKLTVFVDGEQQEIILEEGEWYFDETFGRVRVLKDFVTAGIKKPSGEVSVHYQGCASSGYCYPPQIKELNP